MSDKILKLVRWMCLLLAVMVGWQVYGIVTAPESFAPLGGLAPGSLDLEEEPPSTETETETTPTTPEGDAPSSDEPSGDEADASSHRDNDNDKPEGDDKKSKGDDKKSKGEEQKKDSSHPPFPAALEVIATSGVLGKAPTKKPLPPALLGTIGKYAMIRSPDGKEDLVTEGGEFGGVKVIRISTNRVLIEYQDRRTELTVYAGMGSSSLLDEEKKNEEKKKSESDSEKKNAGAPGKPTSPDSPDASAPPAAR